jgi:crotonobetainyl-CoA:carnitine CoA-transferase CaiB-like acyl-CoA transferase
MCAIQNSHCFKIKERTNMPVALEGIRVIDLSDRMSGAYAARLFGDYGAEVILVEGPEGHPLRHEAPFVNDQPGPDSSLLHGYINWNKHALQRDDASLPDLIATADIIVTTCDLDPSDPLWETLATASETAVHLSITPHGLTGPLAGKPGNHLTHCARVGWSTINRLQDDGPLQLPLRQTGYTAGIAGYVAAMGAHIRCIRTGVGERVDVSELEVMASTSAPWAIVGLFSNSTRMEFGPAGHRFRGSPGPLWHPANGAINFGFGDWARWRDAMTYLGLDEIATDERYEPVLGRHQQDLRPVAAALEEAVSTKDKWDIFHKLAELHCISGVVQDARELIESEQLAARDFFTTTRVGGTDGQSVRAPGAAAKLYSTPFAVHHPAPALSESRSPESGLRAARPARNKKATGAPPELPLAGVRVLTFTQAWSGTFGTELLAFLGADVVQIEGRKRPDVWRGAGAPVPRGVVDPDKEQNPLNTNGMFNSVNLCKRAITLDMSSVKGRGIFWDMVPQFDIVAENFSPHVMANWGITLATLQEKRPDIIFASLSGYGRQGPLSEYPANGATTEPMSGLTSIHGYEDGEVMNTGGLYPDPVTGYHFAAAMLTALAHKQKTGEGQRIDLAMMEGVAVQVGDAILDYTVNGRIPGPKGNRHPHIAPHNYYATGDDRWVALAAENDDQWQAVASVLGLDEPRFATMANRKQHEAELDQAISAWCAARTESEIEQALGHVQVCFSLLPSFLEVYREPSQQFLHRGYLQPVTHPETGTHYLPTMPWVMTRSPGPDITHAPCFGEHSEEVLAQELGLSRADYHELEAEGITGKTRI